MRLNTMKYEGKVDCPYCGYKGTDFKLMKEWTHGLHLVNRLSCPSCEMIFSFYWGERKDGSFFSYTIPGSRIND